MKAILRTCGCDRRFDDSVVEVPDDYDFEDREKLPFPVGSNQTVLPLESVGLAEDKPWLSKEQFDAMVRKWAVVEGRAHTNRILGSVIRMVEELATRAQADAENSEVSGAVEQASADRVRHGQLVLALRHLQEAYK